MADKLKFTLALLLSLGGVIGFYLLGEQPLIVRVLAVLAGLTAGVALAWFTVPGQVFFRFSQEAWGETRKVVWPERKEAMQTTLMVFVFVLVMAVILWTADKTLEWVLYDLILGWKK